MMKNFYKILQIDCEAELEVIEVAFKRLARKYHPDVSNASNATGRMQEINEAFETLSDKDKRAKYDEVHFGKKQHFAEGKTAHGKARKPLKIVLPQVQYINDLTEKIT